MSALAIAAALLGIALEIAILCRILSRGVAIPCLATMILFDAFFGAAMLACYALGYDWWSPEYRQLHSAIAPFHLALITLASVEAIGSVPVRSAATLAGGVVATMLLAPTPVETRLAILCACSVMLAVAWGIRTTGPICMMLIFVGALAVEGLALRFGETSATAAAFLTLAQLIPLVGWLLWTDRLAEPVRLVRRRCG